jgi:hypothetical protein
MERDPYMSCSSFTSPSKTKDVDVGGSLYGIEHCTWFFRYLFMIGTLMAA